VSGVNVYKFVQYFNMVAARQRVRAEGGCKSLPLLTPNAPAEEPAPIQQRDAVWLKVDVEEARSAGIRKTNKIQTAQFRWDQGESFSDTKSA
jgi:hypothetical protein